MCYHTHFSPNESIYCVVRCTIYRFIWSRMCVITQSFLIRCSTKYIDSQHFFAQHKQIHLEKMGQKISSCKIYIFHTFFEAFKLAFLQKFLNQKVQFSIKIKNMQKKRFEKLVRIIQIHLISLNQKILLQINLEFREKIIGTSTYT